MEHIEVPSYVSSEIARDGFGPNELHPRSIIIDDDGVSFLIGQDALTHSWDSSRVYGGHLEVPQYRNLLRALVAKTMGPGRHESTVAISASHLWIESIREHHQSVYLKPAQEKLLRDTLSSIRFKTSMNSPWQECSVEIIDRPHVYHELAAVSFVIPRNMYQNYVLWQLGHGDLQQIVFVKGKPMPETLLRTEGVSFAVKKLGEILKLPNLALANSAWLDEKVQKSGDMFEASADCTGEKRKACRAWFSQQVIGKLINVLQQYKHLTPNVILSGGGAMDDVLVDVLREEVENLGFKFHPINKLPGIERLSEAQKLALQNPKFTCLNGLATKADACFDNGNSTLKGHRKGASAYA